MNFWEIIAAGEYLIIALAICLIAALLIFFIRISSIGRDMKPNNHFMHRIRDYVIEGDLENARHLSEATDSAAARVVYQGINHVGHPIGEVAGAMHQAIIMENLSMQRGERWLWWIAIVSPLSGLGGCLAGLAVGFDILSEAGAQGDIASLCNVAWPPVITFIVGIGVGIISLTCYVALGGYIAKKMRQLEKASSSFIDLLNEPS